ncbi:DUF6545 domain-containing protein [Pseudonocardia acidicola]|uniref:DUF6545 domain-containing protein n=1 Tax=Pseudonocardia acidicola TaxID=2724939 RepID=A0ABX1SJB8_9PSEU|nr:DUF6545 domain-containing protein [Pseudonocardia acidicola]NMI01652.1 hypothetical protein [Pseudonocardia acidicola]
MPAVVVENVYRGIAVALWVAVLRRGLRASKLGASWWASVLLALVATLKIGSNAELFDRLTGHVWLSVLVANLAAAAAAALVVGSQLVAARPPGRRGRRLVAVALVVVLVVMAATWFASPLHTPPGPGETWIPRVVLGDAAMATHWLVYHLFLLALAATFLCAGVREIRELPAGVSRQALVLVAASSLCAAAWAGGAVVVQAGELLGRPFPPPATVLLNGLLVAFFALFLAGICLPVLRAARRRHDPEQVRRDVTRLWQWLTGRPSGDHRRIITDDELFGLLVEVRDRMWLLQQWVGRDQLSAAAGVARRLGLVGEPGRAFTAAVCLEIGLTALAADADRAADPADLSRLGGGQSEKQEALWLAEVQRARTLHDAAAAAVLLLPPEGATRFAPS